MPTCLEETPVLVPSHRDPLNQADTMNPESRAFEESQCRVFPAKRRSAATPK